MPETVTIVAYHYVRDVARSRFPRLKALDVASFREQLAYLRRHYVVITAEELVAAVAEHRRGGAWALPRNAALLTFDDGYREHYRTVFPLLADAGLQGSFFPPALAVCERGMLDVNKIHFVLAQVPDARVLAADIFHLLDARRADQVDGEAALEGNDALYARLARPSRRDPAEIAFVKRALQHGLPPAVRTAIADELFARYVTADAACFADELYMSADEVRDLIRHGMHVGHHTYSHPWLSHLPPDGQAVELDRGLAMLAAVGAPTTQWIMCYPFGAPMDGPHGGEPLFDALRRRGCALGLTTSPGIATTGHHELALPRLDTNDLPKSADAIPATWTRDVA